MLNIFPDFFVAKTDEKILVPLEEEEEEEQTSKELSPSSPSKEKEDREVEKKDGN